MMSKHRFYLISLIATLTVAGCGKGETVESNFSQRPGFAEFYKANPRSDEIPNSEYQRLLVEYSPRLWLHNDAEGPIDFYLDYIAQGNLVGDGGELLSDAVDRTLLNQHRQSPSVVFTHVPTGEKPQATAYGRVDHDNINGLGDVTVLTWHFVFRHSGLPGGVAGLRRFALDLVGDTKDWHQLDNYTAASLVLDQLKQPLALLLQQHNYQRSYLFGCDLAWPSDNRLALVSAIGSNELYPWQSGEQRWRSVPFMSDKGARYLITGESKPLMSADDITNAQKQIEYQLKWLPPSDAFYSFEGYLGAKRRLPGREGPPGADFNTLPPLKAVASQVVIYNWREDDLEFIDLMRPLRDAAWGNGNIDLQLIPAWQTLLQRFVDRAGSCERPSALD